MWSFWGLTAAEQEKSIDLQVSRLEGHYGATSADILIPEGWYWCSRFAKPMDPESDLVDLPSKTSIDPSLPWTGVSSGYKVGTLNWADGESTSKTVSIKVRDDREMEGTECLNLILVQKDANGKAVDNKNTMVYLRDDDLVLRELPSSARPRNSNRGTRRRQRLQCTPIRRLQGSPKTNFEHRTRSQAFIRPTAIKQSRSTHLG